MKNLIYQYWDGDIPDAARIGCDNMRAYADRIGAEYLFEDNPRFVTDLGNPMNYFYGALKPIYDDKFLEYDNVLYVDTDIFAVSGLEEDIFRHDDFYIEQPVQPSRTDWRTHGVGICTEPFQPEYRLRLNATDAAWINNDNDEKWASIVKGQYGCDVPRTAAGLPKVYNAGLAIWSNYGLRYARKAFEPFLEYVTLIANSGLPHFYAHDQNYLHAMLCSTGIDYTEQSNDWNTIVHFYKDTGGSNNLNDPRNENTKFVHIMLTGQKDLDDAALWRITNLPNSVWRYNRP